MNQKNRPRFRFIVLGRYRAASGNNEPHVTVNLTSGRGDHFVHAGTLTMSEAEWQTLIEALRAQLGDGLEVEDRTRRI